MGLKSSTGSWEGQRYKLDNKNAVMLPHSGLPVFSVCYQLQSSEPSWELGRDDWFVEGKEIMEVSGFSATTKSQLSSLGREGDNCLDVFAVLSLSVYFKIRHFIYLWGLFSVGELINLESRDWKFI